jgi:hypothetical protein
VFNKSYIKHLKEEINYLRKQNEEYQRVIVALKDKTVQYNTIHSLKETDKVKEVVDNIIKKEALSDEEKAQKQIALEHLKELGIA